MRIDQYFCNIFIDKLFEFLLIYKDQNVIINNNLDNLSILPYIYNYFHEYFLDNFGKKYDIKTDSNYYLGPEVQFNAILQNFITLNSIKNINIFPRSISYNFYLNNKMIFFYDKKLCLSSFIQENKIDTKNIEEEIYKYPDNFKIVNKKITSEKYKKRVMFYSISV